MGSSAPVSHDPGYVTARVPFELREGGFAWLFRLARVFG